MVGKYGCVYCDMLQTSAEEDRSIQLAKRRTKEAFQKNRGFEPITLPLPARKDTVRGGAPDMLEKRMIEFPIGSVWGPWEVIGVPEQYSRTSRGQSWQVRCKRVTYGTTHTPLGSTKRLLLSKLRAQGRRDTSDSE